MMTLIAGSFQKLKTSKSCVTFIDSQHVKRSETPLKLSRQLLCPIFYQSERTSVPKILS